MREVSGLGTGSRGMGLCQGHAERGRCAGSLVLGALGCSGLQAQRPEVGEFPCADSGSLGGF